MAEISRFTIFAAGEIIAATADCTAELRIGRTQIAMLAMWQRLVLRLLRHRVRDAVRQAAQLRKQQGKNQHQAE